MEAGLQGDVILSNVMGMKCPFIRKEAAVFCYDVSY